MPQIFQARGITRRISDSETRHFEYAVSRPECVDECIGDFAPVETEGVEQLQGRLICMLINGTVNLWKKDLRCVPAQIWQQISVEVLVLANNSLLEISPEIRRLQNLRTLDLGHNQIAELPDAIGDLKSLRDFLYLHDNRLTSLPSSLGQLQELRYLNISKNDFSEFPECVVYMNGLIELRVADNQLSSLPDTIMGLSKLRELHLRNNQLRTLPASIGTLSELRHIDLRGNPIQALPDTMATLPRLEKLDLRWVDTLQEPAWLRTIEDRGGSVYR